MVPGLYWFKLALLAFWALWFAVVVLTNVLGGLKAMGRLPESWTFASTNYEAVARATARYRPPAWVPALLFAAVVAWQVAVAALLAWALAASIAAGSLAWPVVNLALAGGIALWAAFMLADEVTLEYQFERTHELLFLAQMASLMAMHLLPGG